MKCANCGAELRVGCVYCSVCGREAQIVSDYNLLEDDFLREVLQEKEEKKKKQEDSNKNEGKITSSEQQFSDKKEEKMNSSEKKKSSVKKKTKKKKKSVIWAFIALILLIVLIVGIILLVNYSNDHSYEYQMKEAKEYLRDQEYLKAEKCLKRALELENNSLDARLHLVEIYLSRTDINGAVNLLQEVIRLDNNNQQAYQQLIQVYAEQKNYEAIKKLSEDVTNRDILQLFDKYLVEPPVFHSSESFIQEELIIKISGEIGCTIYYTMDGSDPKQGKEYKDPILIEPGREVKIRAICCNSLGIYSDEIAENFLKELEKPDPPRVTPDGGNFYAPQSISIYVPEGCSVYYTWDGSAPTQDSKQYTEPIYMPEGNNILSLILVDKYGMVSDVLKCNYIYIPQG